MEMKKTKISMIYGVGMRNISAGAVIASAYFPAEVVFPVITATLFQQILAAVYGVLIKRYLHFPNSPFKQNHRIKIICYTMFSSPFKIRLIKEKR